MSFMAEIVIAVTAPAPRRPYSGSGCSRHEEVPMASRILIPAVGLLIALALLAAALVAVTTAPG
jgi:hypothetical protein